MADSSAGEQCEFLPAWVMPPSGKTGTGPISVIIGVRASDAGGPCPKPSPWRVSFVDEQDRVSPISPLIMAEAAVGMTLQRIPLAGRPPDWVAELRPEHIVMIESARVDAIQGDNWDTVLSIKDVVLDYAQRIIKIFAQPQVFSLEGKQFEFRDLQGAEVDRCEMELDVAPKARWGDAWQTLEQQRGAIVLQPEGGPRYSLTVKGPQGRRLANVDLSRLFVRRASDNNDLSVRLKHSNPRSEAHCFLPVDNITGADLEAGIIARTVGKPQPALMRFITVDGSYETGGLRKEEYEFAIEHTLDLTNEIGTFTSVAADRRPYMFHVTAVIQEGQVKALPDAVPSGLELDRVTYGKVMAAIRKGIADRAPGSDLSKLRSYVGNMFRNRQGNVDRQPADIILIGRVIDVRGDSRFCNPSAQSTVAPWRQDWLSPETRHVLEIAFANSDTINRLVAAEALAPIPGIQRNTVFACRYNIQGFVEQLVISVPRGQRAGLEEAETKNSLLLQAQTLFKVQRSQ
jgi:hypothetical protein